MILKHQVKSSARKLLEAKRRGACPLVSVVAGRDGTQQARKGIAGTSLEPLLAHGSSRDSPSKDRPPLQ